MTAEQYDSDFLQIMSLLRTVCNSNLYSIDHPKKHSKTSAIDSNCRSYFIFGPEINLKNLVS